MSAELDQEILEKYQDWKTAEAEFTQLYARSRELHQPIIEWEEQVCKHVFLGVFYDLFKIGYPKKADDVYWNADHERSLAEMRKDQLRNALARLVTQRPGEYPLLTILAGLTPNRPEGYFEYRYGLVIGEVDFTIICESNCIVAKRATDTNATVMIEGVRPPVLSLPEEFKILRKIDYPLLPGFQYMMDSVYYHWQPSLTENPQAIAPNDSIISEWRRNKEEALTYTDFVVVRNFKGGPSFMLTPQIKA